MYSKPVSEIMTRSVVSVHMNERIDKAIYLFLENSISILPVVNTAGCCVGVVTLKDVVAIEKAVTDSDQPAKNPVGDIAVCDAMSSEFVWIGQHESIVSVIEKTLENSIHHLVVLDENRGLVGVVSSGDILKQINEFNL